MLPIVRQSTSKKRSPRSMHARELLWYGNCFRNHREDVRFPSRPSRTRCSSGVFHTKAAVDAEVARIWTGGTERAGNRRLRVSDGMSSALLHLKVRANLAGPRERSVRCERELDGALPGLLVVDILVRGATRRRADAKTTGRRTELGRRARALDDPRQRLRAFARLSPSARHSPQA